MLMTQGTVRGQSICEPRAKSTSLLTYGGIGKTHSLAPTTTNKVTNSRTNSQLICVENVSHSTQNVFKNIFENRLGQQTLGCRSMTSAMTATVIVAVITQQVASCTLYGQKRALILCKLSRRQPSSFVRVWIQCQQDLSNGNRQS
jgi:hypothetical protein